jgi:hypothetical protein
MSAEGQAGYNGKSPTAEGEGMTTALTIHDETTSGERSQSLTLHLPDPTITARELIRARVFEEVRAYNACLPERFRGLVQPVDTERELNGYKFREQRKLDWHAQSSAALEAFGRNGFVLLVNDRQIESLDEEIRVKPETQVTFLKLVPLVGG